MLEVGTGDVEKLTVDEGRTWSFLDWDVYFQRRKLYSLAMENSLVLFLYLARLSIHGSRSALFIGYFGGYIFRLCFLNFWLVYRPFLCLHITVADWLFNDSISFLKYFIVIDAFSYCWSGRPRRCLSVALAIFLFENLFSFVKMFPSFLIWHKTFTSSIRFFVRWNIFLLHLLAKLSCILLNRANIL